MGISTKRKALYIATTVGFVLGAPIVYLKWLDAAGDPLAQDLGAVPEFLTSDASGQPMSRFDLEGNLTFVAWLGGVCSDRAAPACRRAQEQLGPLTAWIEKRLLYSDKDEQTPVRLVGVAPADLTLPAAWRKLAVAADGSGDAWALLPASCGEAQAPLIVIDQYGHARRCFSLAGSENWSDLQPLLSRMTINHYMHDYLAKRTFFRRAPKDASQDAPESTH